MRTKRCRPIPLSLPAIVIAFSVSLLFSQPAHAQFINGCASAMPYFEVPCSLYFPNCNGVFYTYDPLLDGSEYAWDAWPQNKCCGRPVMVYNSRGLCVVAGPSSQADSSAADRLNGARGGRAPLARSSPVLPAHSAIPEYLAECKGRYVYYLAPASN